MQGVTIKVPNNGEITCRAAQVTGTHVRALMSRGDERLHPEMKLIDATKYLIEVPRSWCKLLTEADEQAINDEMWGPIGIKDMPILF